MMLEHATYPRRREETFPEPFVLYPRREIFEDMRRSEERLVRLAGLPVALEEFAEPASNLPQFTRRSALLDESFGLAESTNSPHRIAPPLVKNR